MAKSTSKPKVRLESTEQIIFVNRVRHFHPDILIIAIPNGGLRDVRTAARLKAEGVLAGVPDLLIPHARKGFNGLFIEMKRTAGGKVSDKQERVAHQLTENGYLVVITYGAEEAYVAFKDYFSIR